LTTRVLLEVVEGVATITLNYPERQNRLVESMREDLLACVLAASDATDVRCIIITGAGEDFCGGADVKEMLDLHRSGNADEVRRRVGLGSNVVRAIRSAPQPVLAAVNGLAAGAGVGLALACDIRLGSDRTRFAASFVRLGLLPDWGGLDSVVRAAGDGAAADILLSGNPVSAERALSVGLLQHLYPLHEFDARVHTYAVRIARFPRLAVFAIKERLIATSKLGHAESLLDFELSRQSSLFLSPECGTALQSFVDRERHNHAAGNTSPPH
jgi:2-(1,2-epoxy-1,2-dihydrophenyl)acetyl-CoA isomerase